jgi:ORF6N domain
VPKKSIALRVPALEMFIYEIRGQRVMLDSDLARIYGVPTKAFNPSCQNVTSTNFRRISCSDLPSKRRGIFDIQGHKL